MAEAAGKLEYDETYTREVRNRYGETVQQTSRDLKIKLGKQTVQLPNGAMIKFTNGTEVSPGAVLAEYIDSTSKQLTEKAFKDVITDMLKL